MHRIVAAVLLTFAAVPVDAQEGSQAARLQCHGTLNGSAPDLRDVPISGIYVEVTFDSVKILGAAGFDSTYSVVTRKENGIGFQLKSDSAYGGFLNRLSGELSLSQQGEAGVYLKFINATCSRASPLF
jgi:hypothetical protein